MRSLLATSIDEYRNTRSLLAISNNLESHLAIPFIQSWDIKSLLATSIDEYRNARSLLAISNNLESHLAIPFNQSWNIRSLLATSIEIWDPFWQSPLTKHLGIPSGDSLLPIAIDVVLPAGRFWKILSSLLVVLESTQWFFLRPQSCWNALRSPPVTIQKNIYAMIYD